MSRSRAYVFTYNNPPDGPLFEHVECQYITYGIEFGDSGTKHAQGYVHFSQPKSLRCVIRLLPGAHIEPRRGTAKQAIEYCHKDGDIFERGTKPLCPGDREKLNWEEIWVSAKLGDLEAIPPDVRLRHYATIRRIERDYMPAVARLTGPCGLWIWGESGAGKSRAVLDAFPEAYPKPTTKWWDGYQGEEVVYLDDVSVFHVALGDSIKLWADAYPFIGESKGGAKKIRPRKFIVTSQYQIETIWKDEETKSALLRRFIVIEKKRDQNIILL